MPGHPVDPWLALPLTVPIALAILGAILVSAIYAVVVLPIVAVIALGCIIAIWRRAADPDFRANMGERERRPLGAAGVRHEHEAAAPGTPDERGRETEGA